MESITEFIKSLGHLHDAKVLGFVWRRSDRTLEIEIHNLYVDLEGFQDYPGPTKARFVFSQVKKIDLDVDLVDAGMIYNWSIESGQASNFISEIVFSPQGKVIVECNVIECIKG